MGMLHGYRCPRMDTNRKHGQGHPLSDATRERLRAFVEARGDYEAATLLGIGHPTVARALAGLRLKRSTGTAIEARLASIEAERVA